MCLCVCLCLWFCVPTKLEIGVPAGLKVDYELPNVESENRTLPTKCVSYFP